MIIDSTERFVIDNMGWVDKAALWFLDLSTGAVRQVPLGTGDYLTLMGGERDLFVAVRRESMSLLEATVHSAASPPDVLARLRIEQGRATFSGRADLWASVPRVFVADHSRFANVVRPLLFLVDHRRGTVDFQELPWYSDGYDLMYQGLLDPVSVPDSDLLLMPIQRDSEPVIYDLTERRKVGTMKLADRHDPAARYQLLACPRRTTAAGKHRDHSARTGVARRRIHRSILLRSGRGPLRGRATLQRRCRSAGHRTLQASPASADRVAAPPGRTPPGWPRNRKRLEERKTYSCPG